MNSISKRKLEHLEICLEHNVEPPESPFREIFIIPRAIPDLDLDEVEISTKFLGRELGAPLLISSITGGHPRSLEINSRLAEVVQELKLGMGVGSQRAALDDPRLRDSFWIARQRAPDAFIYANIGISQLRSGGIEMARKCIQMIDADAIAVHLNFLQEGIQGSNDLRGSGCFKVISQLCSELDIPVIVKEVGGGMDPQTGSILQEAGVAAIDVGGWGGTNFAMVESIRALNRGDDFRARMGMDFRDWGIPTPVSVAICSSKLSIPIIAGGGIRSGLDMAKALGLGAQLCSIALPALRAAAQDADTLRAMLMRYIHELKLAMFLAGASKIPQLKTRVIPLGRMAELIQKLG